MPFTHMIWDFEKIATEEEEFVAQIYGNSFFTSGEVEILENMLMDDAKMKMDVEEPNLPLDLPVSARAAVPSNRKEIISIGYTHSLPIQLSYLFKEHRKEIIPKLIFDSRYENAI